MEFELYDRKFKLVDDILYSFYKKNNSKTEKWYIVKLYLSNRGYNRFCFKVKGKQKAFYFHRVVYLANNPEWNLFDSSINNVIDHIDNVKTNNHISNLRNITQHENNLNKRCKGYYFHKKSGKYKAEIQLNRKKIHIGYYNTEEEAREAYLNKKAEVHIIQAR